MHDNSTSTSKLWQFIGTSYKNLGHPRLWSYNIAPRDSKGKVDLKYTNRPIGSLAFEAVVQTTFRKIKVK